MMKMSGTRWNSLRIGGAQAMTPEVSANAVVRTSNCSLSVGLSYNWFLPDSNAQKSVDSDGPAAVSNH